MKDRPERYRLGFFTWIFIGFFAGSLVLLALIGFVAVHAAGALSLDVARREMTTAVELAARQVSEPKSQAAFLAGTAAYRRGLVLYEPGPLTFTLVAGDGHIAYTSPASLDGKAISAQALRLFRTAAKGSAVLYLPLRRASYLLAWQKTPGGYLSALVPESPLFAAMLRNLLRDLGDFILLRLAVVAATALVLGFMLSRMTRRLRNVYDEASADEVYRRTRVRELADIARRWGDVLRQQRQNAASLSRAFAWRDRLTAWLTAVSSQPDQDLASLAGTIVEQLPFPVAQLSVADPKRNVSFPLAMRGYGSMTVRDLTLPLDPPTGLVSHAYQERRTICLPQDRELARIGMPAELGSRAAVAVPLIADGAVRGVLTAAVHDMADLPPEAVQSLEQIAPLIGALIARQDAVDRLRRQERLFLWVQEMNPLLMTGRVDSNSWWPPIARALEEIIGARAAVILVRRGPDWRVAGSFGPGLPLLFAGTPIREWIAQIEQEPRRFRGWREEGVLCTGGVGAEELPDVVLLVLASIDGERRFLLHTLFDYLALANETSVQRAAVRELRHIDPLTGVLNRRALEERFEEIVASQVASDGPAFLFVLLDLDNFKELNDRDGHQAGDRALKAFGQHLRSRLRAEDTVGRIGGDEFVLLLQQTEGLSPTRLAELLSAPLAAGGLKASYGSALVPDEALSFADAYRLADRRMYHRKRERRSLEGERRDA